MVTLGALNGNTEQTKPRINHNIKSAFFQWNAEIPCGFIQSEKYGSYGMHYTHKTGGSQ